MPPRTTKEIRVLLPSFGLTLLATVPPFLGWTNEPEGWMLMLFCVGCVFMGAEAFGSEFQQRTLPLLLTQPVSRSSLWREKMQVLGTGLVLGTIVPGVILRLFQRRLFHDLELDLATSKLALGLIPFCAFCAAPFWTLLYRSTLGGVVFSFAAPGMILGLNTYVHAAWVRTPGGEGPSAITLLVFYSAVCCWLGYNRFRKLQVVDANSLVCARELGVPARLEALLLAPFRTLSSSLTGPFVSLLKKELRLQSISFLGAALFFTLAVAGFFLQQLHWGARPESNWTRYLLVADFVCYLPVLPLLAGAVCVAEEKTWGLTEWHLTLPPSALKQWCAKILVALGTSLMLGLVLPAALALVGSGSFRSLLNPLFPAVVAQDGGIASVYVALAFLLYLVLNHLLLTSVAIYAACLSRNTSGALVRAMAMLGAAGYLVSLTVQQWQNLGLPTSGALWQGRSPGPTGHLSLLVVGSFILLCLLHRFAYTGFRTPGLTRRQLWVQAAVLAGMICFLTVLSCV